MAEQTAVDADDSFDMSEAPDDAEVDTGHYRLDEPVDVRVAESLGEPIHLEDVEYVAANRVHTTLDEEDKAFRMVQSDAYDDIEDVEDEVTVAEVIHSDADGATGIKLMQVETEDSLDEIVKRFADDSTDDTNE